MSYNETKFLTGSICLTDLNDAARNGHSSFSKGKNGKIYFNFQQWINEKPDQYNNDSSLLLQSTKEKRELETKTYIGNARFFDISAKPLTPNDSSIPTDDDLPF